MTFNFMSITISFSGSVLWYIVCLNFKSIGLDCGVISCYAMFIYFLYHYKLLWRLCIYVWYVHQ